MQANNGIATTCSVDGCHNPIWNKGRQMCSKHNQRWLKHGDVEHNERIRNRKCSVPGCYRPHDTHGRCGRHRYWESKGEEAPAEDLSMYLPGDFCEMECRTDDCIQAVRARGLCKHCYDRWYRNGGVSEIERKHKPIPDQYRPKDPPPPTPMY